MSSDLTIIVIVLALPGQCHKMHNVFKSSADEI